MDSTDDRRSNLPKMQIPLLGPKESAESREAANGAKREANDRTRAECRAYYQKNKEKLRKRALVYRAKNRDACIARQKKYYQDHREHRLAIAKKSYLKTRETILVAKRAHHAENREAELIKGKMYRDRWKDLVFGAYGEFCKCCGESDRRFLTIDHIHNGRGNPAQRIGSHQQFYRWLIKNSFPSDFQTLCIKCNWAKGQHGVCPHSELTTPIDIFLQAI